MFQQLLRLAFVLVCFALASLSLATAADDPHSVDRLVEQLSSPRFAQRQDAMKKLDSLGVRASENLRRAVESDNAEASTRSLEILEKHFKSDDTTLSDSAKRQLELLSENEQSSIADRAKAILHPPATPSDPINLIFGNANNVIRIGGGNAQIQINGIGGQNIQLPPNVQRRVAIQMNGRQITTTIRNGIKSVKVTENNESTEVTENKDGSLEVTETDAAGKSTKSVYKNESELKEKNAKAHEVFKSTGVKEDAGLPKAIRSARNDAMEKHIQSIEKNIEEMKERKKDPNFAPHADRMIERLEKTKEQFEKMKN